uniref:Uncharacterized protein n=1 Tax=Arundo donax TaxID=35708 RepID=A0A0A9GX14_ARUDO
MQQPRRRTRLRWLTHDTSFTSFMTRSSPALSRCLMRFTATRRLSLSRPAYTVP